MSGQTTVCAQLYNDMAAVIFGLYENKDNRSPYSLFVVSIEKDTIYVFSSEKHIGPNKETTPYKEWRENNKDDELDGSVLRYEPSIAEYNVHGPKQEYNEDFFKKLFGITKMKFLNFWPGPKDRVYIMLYKKPLFKNRNLPSLMLSACEETYNVWRVFFSLFSGKYPRLDINKIIVTLPELKKISLFFETVTTISSLFYEKSRSKGSITITKTRISNPSVQFKTDDKIEMLSFSKENARQLRKLLETTRNDLSLLVHDGKIYGIGKPDPDKILYTFNLTGHLEWHVLKHHGNAQTGIQVLHYKHGEYYIYLDNEIRHWYIRSKIKNNEAVCDMVENLFNEENIKQFDHGALIIITDEAEAEVKRLCKLKRGLKTEPIVITNDCEKTSTLCAIDGALFVDKKGCCYGIGIILDGKAKTIGTPDRGARYNSAMTYMYRFVGKKTDAYALIVSSDGYFDILTNNEEEFNSGENTPNKEGGG